VTIDATQRTSDFQQVVRSRVADATASYFPRSKRIVLVADRNNFGAAFEALTELRDYYGAEMEVDAHDGH